MSSPWSNQVVSQVIVGQAPNEQIVIGSSGTAARIQFPSNQALEKAPGELIGEVLGSGLGLFLALVMFGPQANSTADRALIELSSSTADSTGGAGGQLIWSNASGTDFTIASWGPLGWQFFDGNALPLAVPTGYPLAATPTVTQLATTVNSLIAILIAANIIT